MRAFLHKDCGGEILFDEDDWNCYCAKCGEEWAEFLDDVWAANPGDFVAKGSEPCE